MNTNQNSRRQFLTGTAAACVATAAPYHFMASKALAKSSNERLQFGLIGAGGNSRHNAMVGRKFANLVAICDVDSQHLAASNQLHCEGKADEYSDYRKVIERDDIGAVLISTPDHWHTKILVEAMLAGKDAYCEKPLTLTIDEGKLIRRVQQETGRVVQVGTQQRSTFDKFNKALAIIAEGRLGKLRKVTVGIDAASRSPEIPIAEVPQHLDWNRWLGPAPKTDYRYLAHPKKNRGYSNGHANFRWWYEYSGGKLTDWGAHHVDIAMLGIAAAGQSNDPVSVDGTGDHPVEFSDGFPSKNDRYNTAHQFDLTVAFADGDVEMNIRHDVDRGVLFEGELGRIFVNRKRLVGKPVEQLADKPLADDAISKIYRSMPMVGNERSAHWANFLHAIENRVLPISDVHSHMKMLHVCHLAGICLRLGRKINWDQANETIVGDELALSMMQRPYRQGFEIEM